MSSWKSCGAGHHWSLCGVLQGVPWSVSHPGSLKGTQSAGLWLLVSGFPTLCLGFGKGSGEDISSLAPSPLLRLVYQGWQGWGWGVLWQEIHFSPEYPKLSPDKGPVLQLY